MAPDRDRDEPIHVGEYFAEALALLLGEDEDDDPAADDAGRSSHTL